MVYPGRVALVLILVTSTGSVTSQGFHMNPAGYKDDHDPSYVVLAPKVVRPGMDYTASVTILRMYHTQLHVHVSISSAGREHASASSTFTEPTSRQLQMLLPDYLDPGRYVLKVHGSPHGAGSRMGNLFYNETELVFQQKYASLFIQLHKPFYKQEQTVKFRIVAVQIHLQAKSGALGTIYVIDPTGTVVRRWLEMQINEGMWDMEFRLSDQPTYGTWKIQVNAWGYTYEKEFEVEEFFLPRFYVNVSMPAYIKDKEFAIAGLITANHTSGSAVSGSIHLRLEVRPALKDIAPDYQGGFPSIERDIAYFHGRRDFMFPLQQLRKLVGRELINHEIHVTVEVSNWDLEMNETGFGICVIYGEQVNVVLLGDQSRTFKPGHPVEVYFAVAEEDGVPLTGRRRQVTIDQTTFQEGSSVQTLDLKVIVPDDGIVRYTFVPSKTATRVEVQAHYDLVGLGRRSKTALFSRAYSHYNQYISVSSSTLYPKVNHYMVFTVRTNFQVGSVYYLIMAAGNIVLGSQLVMKSHQKTFSVALSLDMVPSAHIVVYGVNHGEVVVDTLNFHVDGTGENPVYVRITTAEDFTRNTVTLTSFTGPEALVAFGGIDYDLYRYGGSTFLTEQELVADLLEYDRYSNQSFQHTWFDGSADYYTVFLPAGSYAPDANTTFSFAGLFVVTDANLTRFPYTCNETLGELPCNTGGRCYEVIERCDGQLQCQDGADELGCPVVVEERFTPLMKRFKHLPPHFEIQDDWLWKTSYNKHYGQLDFQVPVPKTPISWVFSAISMNLNKGLGLVSRPARYTSTRFFYAVVEGPHHAHRGEQLGLRVATFNYWNEHVEALVTLHDSPLYRFVVVDGGVVSSYAPRTTRGNIQTLIFIKPGRSRTIYMPVLPMVYHGTINITISVISLLGKQTIVHPVTITYNGVTNHYHTPYFIDLINQGSVLVPDFDIPVPEQFVVSRRPWHLYVQGSAYIQLGLIGDMMGPGYYESFLNSEMWMDTPYGGAEQSIFNYALNLYYLQFLKITNQLEHKVLSSGLSYMNVALQRITSYMNATTGAFSMFRDKKGKPSIWVSAIVLETLANTYEGEWQHQIYIPRGLVDRVSRWLCDQQAFDGSFHENDAPIYDTKYKDVAPHSGDDNAHAPPADLEDAFVDHTGRNDHDWIDEAAEWGEWSPPREDAEDEDNDTRDPPLPEVFDQVTYEKVTLTALVLTALTKARVVTGYTQTLVSLAKVNAMIYLEPRMRLITDPFQMALVTYALTLADSNVMGEAFQRLHAMRRETAYIYWSRQSIPDNPTEIVNTVPFLKARMRYPNEASAVEGTSYALLVYLRQNRQREALVIMKWLQTMRNTFGGFASTRDSLVALQALCQFSMNDENRAIYNIRVRLEFTADTSLDAVVVHLNHTNWQQMQWIKCPENKVYGQVKASVIGTGMALLQMHTTVDVEYTWLQQPAPTAPFFNLTFEELHFRGRNSSILEMRPCVMWNRPDIRNITGLVVLEVDLPTGYVTMNDRLRDYVRSGQVPQLARAYFQQRQILFYFETLEANRPVCVDLRADRWYPVANMTIQHKVKVYDFYEPGMHNTSMYTTYGLFTLNICRACGSFQCPYCPNYNLAAKIVPSSLLLMTSLILTLWRFSLRQRIG